MSVKTRKDKKKRRTANNLRPVAEGARELAQEFGLDPYKVNYWIVDHDEMNALIAYGGFQNRYPHWRWGMTYDRQQKQGQYMGGKAFEIVNNDNPSNAFLQMSNSIPDQKAVITHVEAHADFFKNNRWFADDPGAVDMLARHARNIQQYMQDPDIGREAVETWIDHVLCLVDNINQHSAFVRGGADPVKDEDVPNIADTVDELDLSERVKEQVFDEGWLDDHDSDGRMDEPERDLLAFLLRHGQAYDEEESRAVEYEAWQFDVLEMLREEAYYFAPQKMTKIMNEGWAAYWESMMMGDAGFVDETGIIEYADHQSLVLNSLGFNPYSLGKSLWEYIENSVNRREVVDKLLRVEGITWETFHTEIDFQSVQDTLDKRDSDVLVERHYSLTKSQNQGVIKAITRSELERMSRYVFETRYDSVAEALADVEYEAGWNRMREVRETHNDVSFIDEFLTQEFVDDQQYYSYEYNHNDGNNQIASKDVDGVRKKFLLQLTNFGKPSIVASEWNFNNKGELLLLHQYNGVMLDLQKVEDILKRVFELWGRPVCLKTIVKTSADGTKEEGRLFRYDGEEYEAESLDWADVKDIAADDIDYDTKPEDWL